MSKKMLVSPGQGAQTVGMGRDLGLVEKDGAFRVDPGGEEGGRPLAGLLAQFGGVLPDGDRVHVDHAVEALEPILQPDPVAQRAEVVAEVQVARRLDAGKDAVHVRLRLAVER